MKREQVCRKGKSVEGMRVKREKDSKGRRSGRCTKIKCLEKRSWNIKKEKERV